MAKNPPGGIFFTEYSICSLNSLAVRVPHNISRRVSASRTPDPWAVAGGCWLLAVAGTGFTIKPMVFQFLFGLFACKTNGFSTISVAGSIKPMVFQRFRLLGL